jgi:hypothetical protein
MSLLDQINSDLKQALLSGDRTKSETLKSMKNALHYAQTSVGAKGGLNDADRLAVLKKESKKRQEAAEAYEKAGDSGRRQSEKQEKDIIDGYLPEQLDEDQVKELVERVIQENGIEKDQKNMGQIIKLARGKIGAQADGALIAKAAKEKVSG